jgi:NADH-quinone oxidoreductase subunit B
MAKGRVTSLHVGEEREEGGALVTRVDSVINWARKNSMWPMPMGLSCCAIEFMAAAASRFDISRFGAEVARFSPKQADVMIVAGTMTYKMGEAVRRLYDQMAEPKWVIAMGACVLTGHVPAYPEMQGIDHIVPGLLHPRLPAGPEMLLNALMEAAETRRRGPFVPPHAGGASGPGIEELDDDRRDRSGAPPSPRSARAGPPPCAASEHNRGQFVTASTAAPPSDVLTAARRPGSEVRLPRRPLRDRLRRPCRASA